MARPTISPCSSPKWRRELFVCAGNLRDVGNPLLIGSRLGIFRLLRCGAPFRQALLPADRHFDETEFFGLVSQRYVHGSIILTSLRANHRLKDRLKTDV